MVLNFATMLQRMVRLALYEELITYPKPGLVSLVDCGSHKDMDAKTFLASIKTLEQYFASIIEVSSTAIPFSILNQLGLDAELAMLQATKQVNTHRGAIFILGLLVAATVYTYTNNGKFNAIRSNLVKLWSEDLFKHQQNQQSHGAKVRNQYQLNNIVADAAHGFPRIFALQHSYMKLCQLYGVKYARLVTLFLIMQELDDTNLVYRGGIAGLKFAQSNARSILMYKSNPLQFYQRALKLHDEFIQHNLSPGGCADVLAAVIFVSRARQLWA